MLEVVALTYDGAATADETRRDLHARFDDPWVDQISLVSRDSSGEYTVDASNPAVEQGHAVKGATIGGLTGLFIGAIGGPMGIAVIGAAGALTGGSIGRHRESAFHDMVKDFEDLLDFDYSMLVLVGDASALDAFISAAAVNAGGMVRRPLTEEQERELAEADRD